MESSGLVVGERAHVPGHRVRKTVYRLTHEGWIQAMKLRGRLHTDIVEVLAPGLDPTPMRVAEIPEIFPAYVNMTAAVSLVRRGRLDFTRLHGIGSGAVAPLLWGDTLRRLGRVFRCSVVLKTSPPAPPDFVGSVRAPLLGFVQEASTKLLLISPPRPATLMRRKVAKDARAEVLQVHGLDLEASLSLLRAKGFAGDDVALQRAASSARGHPILLSFAAQTGSSVSGEMTRYLEREIWRTLSKDERTILEASSLFRGLIPADSLHCFSDEWQAAVHRLQAKNLLAPTISRGVGVHDTIREYIRERLPEARRGSFHSLAAAHFMVRSQMLDPVLR